MNRLINNVCFRVRSISKQEKQGNSSEKIHSDIYSTWYMKVIWKIQYKFADTKINLILTWWYWSKFTRHCTLNISYRKRRPIFSALLFYKHSFLPLVTWHSWKICWRKVTRKSFMDNFDLFLLNKLTYSLSSCPLYTLKLLWRIYFSK